MELLAMSNPEHEKRSITSLSIGRRKAVSILPEELVKTSSLEPGKALPLVIEPTIEGVDLIDWASRNREFIETQLLKHGGLLFRKFAISDIDQFETFVQTVVGELLQYRERSSPRSQISGNIYTSTDHPADQSIFLHNENSYSHTWPTKICFYAVVAAQQGGETPIADCRRVFERIAPKIRERFIQKKVMYVRNFGNGLGLPWQTVFQTNDKAAVVDYCHKAGIQVEWKQDDHLRTRRIGRVAIQHPRTGEMSWFNHATFFHVSTLPLPLRDMLQATFSSDELPTNTFYGDGTPIEPDVLDELRAIYQEETVMFPWQPCDILMLDNMLVAHGRSPFVGPRKVAVAMAQPVSEQDVSE
jgi:alpha-ketoglutarate-dependent taurine dioxygenase